jgi:hypothetical protein
VCAGHSTQVMTRVTFIDMTDNWEQDATLADDIPLRDVMLELLRELGMPERDPHGDKIPYGICVDGQTQMLDPERTLRDNNVWDGMRLRLLAAFTAR